MRTPFRLVVAVVLMLALVPGAANAGHVPDQSNGMTEVFRSPNQATNSDLAFWGNYAFVGYYTGDTGFPPGTGARGGVRIFDISNPAAPVLVRDFACDGQQNDPILWDRNGNGVPDLMLLAVDRTMESSECGAPRSANHGDPEGWEGVRVFTMSDNPAAPFTRIQQVEAVYTDCGAHTITLWPGFADAKRKPRLLAYVSSYPLRPGPTCGDTEFRNTANPYDEDPGSPNNPLHGVIQVVEVPLSSPARSQELDQQPRIRYPGDPDGRIDWCERQVTGLNPQGEPNPCPGPFEPAAVACHDIVVHVATRLAGGACAEQGQVWKIRGNGIPNTQNPISIVDDDVSSGGRGQIPEAVDFFHSAMFDNEAETLNWVDESFGTGCPPRTRWQPRPWQPGGFHQTGYMYFTDVEGDFLSRFHVGDMRPDPAAGEYCSSHMGMSVLGIKRDLLVNAWYTGGVDVIDFTNPRSLSEVAFYDPQRNSGTWSAYPYTGPTFPTGAGVPVYASDGVSNNALAQGMVVYRALIEGPGPDRRVDHLNPQTMDQDTKGRGHKDDDDD
jgi:LVIVD repeat